MVFCWWIFCSYVYYSTCAKVFHSYYNIGMDEYDEDLDIDDAEDSELYDDDYNDGSDDNFDDDDGADGNDGTEKDDYYDTSYYENLGMEDGRFDKDHHILPHSGFGSSVNLDELSDDEREAYEMGYSLGAEDYDLSDDN